MVDTFDAAVTTRGVGACHEFAYIEKFVAGCSQLGADLESVGGGENGWTSPKGNKAVHQNVGGSFSCQSRRGESEHIHPSA